MKNQSRKAAGILDGIYKMIRDYPNDKPRAKSWQGGQSTARRTRGLPTGGAHGVTRPTVIVCKPDNPEMIRIEFDVWSCLI
jgi:hypothetical protein